MNPPYQINNDKGGGKTTHASPLYHSFIEVIIDELCPDFLVSINPSRWMVGGRGLNSFRDRMMTDRRMKTIIHFPGESEVFTSVSIKGGVNYFLWDKQHDGDCEFVVGNSSTKRYLNEFDIVLQDNQAATVLGKVRDQNSVWMNKSWAIQSPFGVVSSFGDWAKSGVSCYSKGKQVKFINAVDFTDKHEIQGKWKVAISKATVEGASFSGDVRKYINGGFVIEPGTICTQTYIVLNVFGSQKEAENFVSYMKTKFFRFMLGLRLLTQSISKESFAWVPDVEDYSTVWTDKELYDKFGLTRQERAYIESKIKELR